MKSKSPLRKDSTVGIWFVYSFSLNCYFKIFYPSVAGSLVGVAAFADFLLGDGLAVESTPGIHNVGQNEGD